MFGRPLGQCAHACAGYRDRGFFFFLLLPLLLSWNAAAASLLKSAFLCAQNCTEAAKAEVGPTRKHKYMHACARAGARKQKVPLCGGVRRREKTAFCWCGASRAGGRVTGGGSRRKLVHKHQRITSACVARTQEPHDCSPPPKSPPRLFWKLVQLC